MEKLDNIEKIKEYLNARLKVFLLKKKKFYCRVIDFFLRISNKIIVNPRIAMIKTIL